MKITLYTEKQGAGVTIENAKGYIEHHFVFDTKKEAEAFLRGFYACQRTINSLVQSLPLTWETKTLA